MEYESGTYFTENEFDDVKGFTVLKADSGEYHIAEKWLASNASGDDSGEDKWMDYWVPESDLLDRVESGDCDPKGTLTDDQFNAVCEAVEWYTGDEEEAAKP